MMKPDPQAQRLLEKIEELGIPPYETLSPELARGYYEKACVSAGGTAPQLHDIKTIHIPGPAGDIAARTYRPSDQQGLPILVFLHGGGFTIGSPDTHDSVCRFLSEGARCIVVSVDYRLGPEHRFPAAVEDAFAATVWVVGNAELLGGDPQRVAIGGDSAGGNLSAVVCLLARESGGPKLIYQLLIYPGTDMTESFASHRKFGQGYLLTNSLIEWFHGNYLPPDANLLDWKASPLHAASHADLPPAHVITAGFDPLQDEGKAYAEKLKESGVPVTVEHYEGMLHGFITQPKYIDKCREALDDCSAKLKVAFETR